MEGWGEVEFEPVEESMLYEATLEEIALEGLDGITLQGLCERVANRPNAPIAKVEAPQVLESLWQSLKRDVRLRFYIIPQRRPVLCIWDRNQHHDPKGNVEEPHDAPEEIYTYRCIEVRDFEALLARRRAKLRLRLGRNKELSTNEINLIDIDVTEQNQGKIVLEGIAFSNSVTTSNTKKVASTVTSNQSPGRGGRATKGPGPKSKKGRNVKKTVAAAPPERKRIKCSPVDNGSSANLVAIRGSCSQYDTRVDITEQLRCMDVSYGKAVDTMGNRLVIVASQFFRESLLFQSPNQIEVNGIQYCTVERVGRARYYGEQARGKISLTVMGVEAKTLFYLRKVLLSDGIISKQPLVMRFGDSRTGTLISVFHLPQFFSRQEHPEALKIRKIFAYVCNAPNNYVDYFKIQGAFGKYMMKTLVDDYKDFIKVEEIPFGIMYPEDLEKEKKAKRKEFLANKKIRVITLRQAGLSLRDLIHKQFSKQETSEQDDEDAEGGGGVGEQSYGEDGEDATFDWSKCYVTERDLAHESELSQLLRLLISKGGLGVKQKELSEEMALTSLDARSAVRYLTRWKITKSHMEEVGRTKVTCLTYFKCDPIKYERTDPESSEDEGNRLTGDSNFNMERNAVDPLAMDELDANSETANQPHLIKRPFVWRARDAEQVGKGSPSPPHKKAKDSKSEDGPPKPKKSKQEKSPKSKEVKLPSPKSVRRQPKSRQKQCPPVPPMQPLEFLEVTNSQKGKARKRLREESDLPPPLIKVSRPRDPLVDFIDVEAANNRDRQRADWTPEEDIAVLYLFIASVIFIPRYNLDKVFVYNSVQMRDVLHRKLPATKTKTSGVVRRRVHGLLKSKTLFSKYRTMLHQALRDEELYTSLIEPYLPLPSTSIFHKPPEDALLAVMDYLSNKFGSEKEGEDSSCLSEGGVADLETLLDTRELRRMETIWTDIWANVFYQYYRTKKILTTIIPLQPEAVQELQIEGIVLEEHGPKWALPYAPPKPSGPLDPDQLCIYSDEQCEFAYELATTLVSTADKVMTEEAPSSSSEDERGENTQPEKRKYYDRSTIVLKIKGRSHVPDLSTGERNPASSLEVFGWTCRSIFMSVLLGGGGSSESLRAFMAPIPDSTLSRLANSLRGRGVFTMLKTSRRLILTNTMKRKLTNFIHPTTFRASDSLLTSLKQNNRACFSQLSVQNIGAAYTLGEIGPLVYINFSLPSCIITVKEEWREDYELILHSQQVSSTDQGREEIALRLLRFRLNADTLKSRLVEKDFFDINLPVIQLLLKDNVPMSLQDDVFSSPEKLVQDKLTLQNKLLQIVAESNKIPTYHMLGKYEGLYQLIDITGDIGISVPFLLKQFGRKELCGGLDYLLENKFIFLVGVRSIKIVTSRHMDKWSLLIPSGNEVTDGSFSTRAVSRPWIDSKGGINWKLVDRLIVGLLGQLHRHSQLYIHRLTQSLSPLLSAVEVLIIISALKELQIVDIFKFRDIRPGRPFNLFSKWSELEDNDEEKDLEAPIKDYAIDVTLDLEDVWVELMPFDVTKYSRIQSIILPQDNVEEEEDDYPRFDPEDVEIMVGHEDQEEEEDDDENEEILP